MKLILILGLLVAIAHCGTEHRRAARAETARSEMMSREAGVVNSDSARQRDLETLESGNNKTRESAGAGAGADSNSRQRSRFSNHQNCFYGGYPCEWSDTYRIYASYGCGIMRDDYGYGRCWHQCVASMRGINGVNALDTSGEWCSSSKDYNGGFFNEEYLECQTHEDCKKQKAFNRGCAGPCVSWCVRSDAYIWLHFQSKERKEKKRKQRKEKKRKE